MKCNSKSNYQHHCLHFTSMCCSYAELFLSQNINSSQCHLGEGLLMRYTVLKNLAEIALPRESQNLRSTAELISRSQVSRHSGRLFVPKQSLPRRRENKVFIMSAKEFAEEFVQLVSRYTRLTTPTAEGAEAAPLLSKQQLVNAVQSVLHVMLGVDLQLPDCSVVKTPATGITVCTPSAPTVPKANLEQGSGHLERFGSLDTLTSLSQSISTNLLGTELMSKSQEKMDIVESETDELLPEKKFISRSSPAIHVGVDRSDTFICEKQEKDAANDAVKKENEDDVFSKDELDPEKMKSRSFLKKMETLRECAFDVIAHIDEVRKEMYPQTTKPIRRLSSVGVFPGLSRSSTLTRAIPPPKLRRSSTVFPGTPTSSKLNTTVTREKEDGSARRKTLVAVAIHSKPSKISPTNRSTTMSLAVSKKSPLSGSKPTKNPKYAHVQSTIPKALSGKRKAQ